MNASAPIVVHGLGPLWGAPDPSPFVTKLLTWLRMAEIPYTRAPLTGPPRGSTKKIPYVELPGGELLDDSTRIIARLTADRGVQLDADLDAQQRAHALLLQRTCESHLYFAALHERWIDDAGYAHVKAGYFASMPAPLRAVALVVARRGAKKNVHGHGLGRLPHDEIIARGRADLDAIAQTLGDRPYALGDAPHGVDAMLLGFLWTLQSHPFPSRLKEHVDGDDVLGAYATRMRDRYWADGPDTVR